MTTAMVVMEPGSDWPGQIGDAETLGEEVRGTSATVSLRLAEDDRARAL
jgi:hypothetical protein